jgi:hypothetical protein
VKEIALPGVGLADQAGRARRQGHVEVLEGPKIPNDHAAYSHSASSLHEATLPSPVAKSAASSGPQHGSIALND